jgi:hypothetical protein
VSQGIPNVYARYRKGIVVFLSFFCKEAGFMFCCTFRCSLVLIVAIGRASEGIAIPKAALWENSSPSERMAASRINAGVVTPSPTESGRGRLSTV